MILSPPSSIALIFFGVNGIYRNLSGESLINTLIDSCKTLATILAVELLWKKNIKWLAWTIVLIPIFVGLILILICFMWQTYKDENDYKQIYFSEKSSNKFITNFNTEYDQYINDYINKN